MSDPRGELKVEARGKTYTLFFSMSVMAKLQAKHGQDVLQRLDPPAGAPKSWVPDLQIVCDMVGESLARYHPDIDLRWTVDDILAEHPDIMGDLLVASFPEMVEAQTSGNGKKPKKAAST